MPAPTFPANAHRFDPYRNFKYRVKWEVDGTPKVVAGISSVSSLTRTTETVTHREGNDPTHSRIMPGTTSFSEITLERGVTHDPEFEKWANLVYSPEGDGGMSLKNYRKDVFIELLNLRGTPVKRYKVFRCWVSEYQALPDLDANDNSVAIERMVIQNEGWERDRDVEEPEEE